MEFKIDTKPTYSIITPVSNLLDANLAAAVRQKWNELTESGSPNIIVDLHNCIKADETGIDNIISLHHDVYAASHSVVFTNLQDEVLSTLKANEKDLLINYAPTINEAVDIVSMELIERELFDEES